MSEPSLNLIIVRRQEQAPGIVVLDLVDPNGGALPPFDAGAHIDVHVSPGLIRQYSLCGDPADRQTYRLGILLDAASRGGSAGIHARFHAGVRIGIGVPRNQFPLAPDAELSILVGGGIGITPMVAMAYHLHRGGKNFALHYCVRSRETAAFLPELETAEFSGKVQTHCDDGLALQRFDPARDLPAPEAGIHLYVCGPSGFMTWFVESALCRGYAEAQIHREYFRAEADRSGDAFEVVLARSNRSIAVPEGTSIVDALTQAGVKVTTSCEEGICGTCLCGVLSGTPDHRDSYLTAEEKDANDQILLCCSRSKTPQLVIDL